MSMLKTEDPYASMEKDQLKSMIHFLVKHEDERTQANLLKSIDKLTNQVADLTTQNKTLQQKVNDLLSQISVGNKVRKSPYNGSFKAWTS